MADISTTTSETAVSRRKAQEVEYGTYVAVQRVSIDGAHAFNVGDPVPVSHVEAYPDLLAQGLVKKREMPAEKPAEKPKS